MFTNILDISDQICRGKRKDNGEWVFGYLIYRNNKSYIAVAEDTDIIHLSESSVLIQVVPVYTHTVGSYVLAGDCDGHNIFTDDVIETVPGEYGVFSETIPGLVSFDNGTFYADGFFEINSDEFEYCRIIGNIHDNPELLDLFPDVELVPVNEEE